MSPRDRIRATLSKPDAPSTAPLDKQRREWEDYASRTATPKGVKVDAITMGAISGLSITPVDRAPKLLLIHIHGGGFTMGSSLTHRVLAAHLALASHAQVVLPDYRLAPEHPFPAARDDAIAAYRWALAQGFTGDRIAWVGDSAGGHVALTALLELPALALPMPRALVLLSPWLDLSASGESMVQRASIDPALTRSELVDCAAKYLNGLDVRAPAVAPIESDLRQLPPLLVHVGEDEILLSDAERLAKRARAANVRVTLKVWPRLWHVFHASAPELPEANQALAEIADFVSQPSAPPSH